MHFTPPVQQVIQSRDDQRDENNFTVASFSMAIQKYPQENRPHEKNADFIPLTMDSSNVCPELSFSEAKPIDYLSN